MPANFKRGISTRFVKKIWICSFEIYGSGQQVTVGSIFLWSSCWWCWNCRTLALQEKLSSKTMWSVCGWHWSVGNSKNVSKLVLSVNGFVICRKQVLQYCYFWFVEILSQRWQNSCFTVYGVHTLAEIMLKLPELFGLNVKDIEDGQLTKKWTTMEVAVLPRKS